METVNPYSYHRQLLTDLLPRYGVGEAQAVTRLVLEIVFGWDATAVYGGKDSEISREQVSRFDQMRQRLAAGEPVQYVLGEAWFLGRRFKVAPGVLIPRPETEELVRWVVEDLKNKQSLRIVDCGTGSGCIAVSLALLLPEAMVEAWDTSETALSVAHQNAAALGANVTFVQRDMALLANEEEPYVREPEPRASKRFDVCVSNPPYVLESERAAMEGHVVNYEPAEALFVPDADPLLHYRSLAASGLPLYLEINAAQAEAVCSLLEKRGYSSVECRRDAFGKPRMVRALP